MIKKLSIACAAVALCGATYANNGASKHIKEASAETQHINQMQKQINQLQAKINTIKNAKKTASPKSGMHATKFVTVRQDKDLSYAMLNDQQTVHRELNLLKALETGDLRQDSVFLAGKGELRAKGQIVGADVTTNIKVPTVEVAIAGNTSGWITAYGQLIAADNVDTNQVGLSRYYVVLGDLSKTPVYAWGGEKMVNFGNFANEATILPTLLSGYFSMQGAQAGVGYNESFKHSQINLNASVINGGGVSNINSVNSSNHLTGVIVDGTIHYSASELTQFQIGGSYSTTSGFVEENGTADSVGMVNVNSQLEIGTPLNNVALAAEGVITTSGVDGVAPNAGFSSQSNTLDTLSDILGYTGIAWGSQSDATVKGFGLDAALTYQFADNPTVTYAGYNGMFQDSDSHMSVVNVGTRMELVRNIWVGVEYATATGNVNSANANGVSTGDEIGDSNTLLAEVNAFF
jgi:uncharacterized protein (DUF4415 family)